MNILALDTSAKTTSVCIASDEQILSEFSVIATQTHSQTLMPMLQSAVQSCGISLKEIDLYAVSNGPGSFTGLRIGIGAIKGVGEKTEKLFRHVGVKTVGDLIRYYPRGFEIFEDPVPVSEAVEGRVCTVAGSVFGRIQVSGSQRVQITTLYLKDLTGTIKVIWFRMPFLRNTLSKGGMLILRGRVVRRRDGLVMEHPEVYYPA